MVGLGGGKKGWNGWVCWLPTFVEAPDVPPCRWANPGEGDSNKPADAIASTASGSFIVVLSIPAAQIEASPSNLTPLRTARQRLIAASRLSFLPFPTGELDLHRNDPVCGTGAVDLAMFSSSCGFIYVRTLISRNGHPLLLQSSSASRFTAGASAFFILSQSDERPER
jgi:hypothetical protein